MFDVWLGDVELTRAVLLVALFLLFPGQLLLCFTVKSRLLRLLPALVLAALTALLGVLYATAVGWERLGYAFLALFAGFLLLVCGAGWGVWALVRRRQSRK